MLVYIIFFFANMLVGLLLIPRHAITFAGIRETRLDANVKLYLFITVIQYGLLCGFRSAAMAYDTGAYEIIFNAAPSAWGNILDNEQYIEIGFSVFCSMVKIFGGSFQTMLIISSLFVMASCCVFIYRHSSDVVLSVFIIICFPFYYSSFDIIRHFIAIAFLLLGYKHVVSRSWLKFLCYIIVGSLFHSIMIIFLPIYFVPRLKFSTRSVLVTAMIVGIALLFSKKIATWVSALLGKGDGIESGWVASYGGGIRTAVMYLCVFLIGLALFYNLKEKQTEDHVALNVLLVLFAVSIIFINVRIMTRIIMAAIPFAAVALPQLLSKTRTRDMSNRNLSFFLLLIIGLLYHAFMLISNWQNVVPYIPYWE